VKFEEAIENSSTQGKERKDYRPPNWRELKRSALYFNYLICTELLRTISVEQITHTAFEEVCNRRRMMAVITSVE